MNVKKCLTIANILNNFRWNISFCRSGLDPSLNQFLFRIYGEKTYAKQFQTDKMAVVGWTLKGGKTEVQGPDKKLFFTQMSKI